MQWQNSNENGNLSFYISLTTSLKRLITIQLLFHTYKNASKIYFKFKCFYFSLNNNKYETMQKKIVQRGCNCDKKISTINNIITYKLKYKKNFFKLFLFYLKKKIQSVYVTFLIQRKKFGIGHNVVIFCFVWNILFFFCFWTCFYIVLFCFGKYFV